MRLSLAFIVSLTFAPVAGAQHPLRHPTDAIEMRLRNVPDSFRLAMARHPEYDDRYSRFARRVDVMVRRVPARRALVLALAEGLSCRRRGLTHRTELTRAAWIHRDHLPTGARSLLERITRNRPHSAWDTPLARHAALESADIHAFDGNEVVLYH
jgi:hypothetical protein